MSQKNRQTLNKRLAKAGYPSLGNLIDPKNKQITDKHLYISSCNHLWCTVHNKGCIEQPESGQCGCHCHFDTWGSSGLMRWDQTPEEKRIRSCSHCLPQDKEEGIEWYDHYFDTDRDLYFKIRDSIRDAYKDGVKSVKGTFEQVAEDARRSTIQDAVSYLKKLCWTDRDIKYFVDRLTRCK